MLFCLSLSSLALHVLPLDWRKFSPNFISLSNFIYIDQKRIIFFLPFFCVRCAELLVMKAELELMKGAAEESRLDLDKVRNLLEICSGLEHSRNIFLIVKKKHQF